MRHDIEEAPWTDVLRSKISLLVLALALGAVSVSAAPASDPAPIHAFRTFTRGSGVTGLPASTVLALSTDHQGTIWIATFDGLARVERGVVERLAPRPNAPVSGPMFDVIARRAGCVYASGAKGLYAFDGTTWTLTPTPQDLISIAEDGGSRIIGLDRRSHTWVKAPGADWVEIPGTEHLELRRVTPLPNGDVLAAGAAGVFRISNGALAGAYGDRAPQGLTTTVVASDCCTIAQSRPSESPGWKEIADVSTRIVEKLTYDAPLADVAAMLADKAFREEVCVAMQATRHSVSIDDLQGYPKEVVLEYAQPTDRVPGFAKKFVGSEVDIRQAETWTSPDHGDIHVTIPGKPGEMVGTAVLTEQDGVTTETVTLDITVRIPLVSGKIEGLIGKLLGSALRAENRTGVAWLSR